MDGQWCGRCIRGSRIAIEIEVYIGKFKNKNKMLSIDQIKIIQKKSNNLLVSSIVASSFGNQENQEMTEFQFFNDQTP